MKSIIAFCLAAIITAVCGTADAACGTAGRTTLSLTVASSCSDRLNCRLHMRLSNRSAKPVELYASLLPWKRYGMLLLAAENRPNAEVLPMAWPTDDPDSRTVILPPHQSLAGDIDLQTRFTTFSSAIDRSDVVLFWSYDANCIGGSSPVARGSLVIPRLAGTK
jgi:hypothetical protein